MNCGAGIDLGTFLSLNEHEGILMCVVDSHRPLDLANIQDPDEDNKYSLFVLDSGDPDEVKPPDLSILDEQSTSGSDDSDSDEDDMIETESDEEDQDSPSSQRRRTSDDGSSEDVEDEEEVERRRLRRRRQRRRMRKELKRQVDDYYAVTHYGATASSYVRLMFHLLCASYTSRYVHRYGS